MPNTHVSDEWNLNKHGHGNFDFIDVNVHKDTKLFIDPSLIELFFNPWGTEARKTVESFFDNFFGAYYEKDESRKRYLLSNSHEQNSTKLGYGRKNSGNGNTSSGLVHKFRELENLINSIETMGKAQDLPLFIPNFAEDGLSDMLTNIIHLQLNNFTLTQMKKHGIKSNGTASFKSWDMQTDSWKEYNEPVYYLKEQQRKKLLLVPKAIVRKSYLFGTEHFFRLIIIERLRNKGGYRDDNGKIIDKNKVMETIKKQNPNAKHWLYNETIKHTKSDNPALSEYHDQLISSYVGKGMSDNNLDKVVY